MTWLLDWFWHTDPSGPTLFSIILVALVFIAVFAQQSIEERDYPVALFYSIVLIAIIAAMVAALVIVLAIWPMWVGGSVAFIAVTYGIYYLVTEVL